MFRKINRPNSITSDPAPGLLYLCCGLILILFQALASAAVGQDSFRPQAVPSAPQWRVIETDCVIDKRLNVHRVENSLQDAGSLVEMFHFYAKSGSQHLVGLPIEPAYVIQELNPELRIKSKRSGVRFYVRVVLPHTEHPSRPGPVTLLIEGPTYRESNRWQELSFLNGDFNIAKLLDQRAPFLRSKYGRGITTREAYVDQLVLDLAKGPGEAQVWIQHVQVDGRVTVHENVIRRVAQPTMVDPHVVPAQFESSTPARQNPNIELDGSVIEIDGIPFAARVIQFNGESFEFLQQLGFNVIKLNSPPSTQQTLEARRLGVWLIAPPPRQAGLEPLRDNYDRVLAWLIGENLVESDEERTKALVREIRQSDPWKDRPLIASVDSGRGEFARQCTIMVNGFENLGGSFLLSEYSDWLRQKAEFAGRAMPMWAVVQTEMSRETVAQAAAIAGRVPPLPVEPGQLQYTIYETIAGGARGHWYLSRTRLDGSDPQSRLRANTLRWINEQLIQLEPWIAGGGVLKSLDSKQDGVEITTLKTNRSRLLLVQRPTFYEQWVCGTPVPRNIEVNNPSSSTADQVYQITEQSLQPLDRGRQLNSTQIKINNCGSCAAIVMTSEPSIIRSISDRMNRNGPEGLVQLQMELTQSWLVLGQIIVQQMQRAGQPVAGASGATNEATNLMQQVSGLAASGSLTSAIPYLKRADQRLALARQQMMLQPRQFVANGSASPLFSHVSLLPLHWELVRNFSSATLKPNGLIGGEFEQLEQLTENGWRNERNYDSAVQTQVELSSVAARRGENGLLLSTSSTARNIETTPLWIKSAKVPVKSGQFVRIHGWVNIPRPISGSFDGFMIMDSVGGRNLAERIVSTRGWQEFTIYRGIPEDTDMQLTFALTGLGQVMLDEVTVQVLEPNSNPTDREARQRGTDQ